MSNPVPNDLALTVIQNGQTADATPVANNFMDIQTATNGLIAALSGGNVGQVLRGA